MQVQQEQIDTVLTKMTHCFKDRGLPVSLLNALPHPCQKARFSGHVPTRNFVTDVIIQIKTTTKMRVSSKTLFLSHPSRAQYTFISPNFCFPPYRLSPITYTKE